MLCHLPISHRDLLGTLACLRFWTTVRLNILGPRLHTWPAKRAIKPPMWPTLLCVSRQPDGLIINIHGAAKQR